MFIIFEVFLIALGLSADAFAVSITNGLTFKNANRGQALRIAAAFGIFQATMPLLGFLLGTFFADFIARFDHYVALVILAFIGGKMLYDGIRGDKEDIKNQEELSLLSLIMQAVATSIDALIAGIVFISMGIKGFFILPCIITIGVVTFCMSFFGVGLGKKFGNLLGNRARVFGGLILIGIGLKVFIEHTFFT